MGEDRRELRDLTLVLFEEVTEGSQDLLSVFEGLVVFEGAGEAAFLVVVGTAFVVVVCTH